MTTPYLYVKMDFSISRSLIETATNFSAEKKKISDHLRVLIAKVACYSVVIFAFVAGFESIVINGTRLTFNVVLWTANITSSFLFAKKLAPQNTSQELKEVVEAPSDLPCLDDFDEIVEILATSGFTLPLRIGRLLTLKEKTSGVHPLLSLGYLLQKNSTRKEHVAIFFKSDAIRNIFLSDTLESLNNAEQNLAHIAFFAENVGIEPEKVHRFLQQEPLPLEAFICEILRE